VNSTSRLLKVWQRTRLFREMLGMILRHSCADSASLKITMESMVKTKSLLLKISQYLSLLLRQFKIFKIFKLIHGAFKMGIKIIKLIRNLKIIWKNLKLIIWTFKSRKVKEILKRLPSVLQSDLKKPYKSTLLVIPKGTRASQARI